MGKAKTVIIVIIAMIGAMMINQQQYNKQLSNGKRNAASDTRGEIINLHWLNSPIPSRQLPSPTGILAVEKSDPDSCQENESSFYQPHPLRQQPKYSTVQKEERKRVHIFAE